uniref:Putative secreted protein n=1 Tax=Anopheles triannulatus TaxID=58253 RepID=A0A2M4B3G8_9DIPT
MADLFQFIRVLCVGDRIFALVGPLLTLTVYRERRYKARDRPGTVPTRLTATGSNGMYFLLLRRQCRSQLVGRHRHLDALHLTLTELTPFAEIAQDAQLAGILLRKVRHIVDGGGGRRHKHRRIGHQLQLGGRCRRNGTVGGGTATTAGRHRFLTRRGQQ